MQYVSGLERKLAELELKQDRLHFENRQMIAGLRQLEADNDLLRERLRFKLALLEIVLPVRIENGRVVSCRRLRVSDLLVLLTLTDGDSWLLADDSALP